MLLLPVCWGCLCLLYATCNVVNLVSCVQGMLRVSPFFIYNMSFELSPRYVTFLMAFTLFMFSDPNVYVYLGHTSWFTTYLNSHPSSISTQAFHFQSDDWKNLPLRSTPSLLPIKKLLFNAKANVPAAKLTYISASRSSCWLWWLPQVLCHRYPQCFIWWYWLDSGNPPH